MPISNGFEAIARVPKRSLKNMVKIRMMRLGSKKSPFYRVMAIDERKQRDGRPLEFLGTYDPRVNPPTVNIDLDAIDTWVGKGAQLSGTVASVVRRVRRSGNTPIPPVVRPGASGGKSEELASGSLGEKTTEVTGG